MMGLEGSLGSKESVGATTTNKLEERDWVSISKKG